MTLTSILIIDAHRAHATKAKIENPDPDLARRISRLPLSEDSIAEILRQLTHPKQLDIEWIRRHKLPYIVVTTVPAAIYYPYLPKENEM